VQLNGSIVSKVQPSAVMLENVAGLMEPVFKPYREFILGELDAMGYPAEWKLLNASDFGVPQLRPWSILVALKKPLFGYFSDAIGGRWFAVGGLLWMSILHGVVGFMPTYETALLIAVVAGFGSAAFHPQGASGANVAAGDRKQAGENRQWEGRKDGRQAGTETECDDDKGRPEHC